MNLSQIEAFVLVANYGSFSKAAKASYISEPTLSKRVKTLEAELGLTLFERSGKRGLTAAGRELIAGARGIVKDVGDWQAVAQSLRASSTQRLTVGYSGGASYEEDITSNVIARFLDSCPSLTITPFLGSPTQILEALNRGAVDVAFWTHEPPELDDLCWAALGSPRLRVLMSKDHRLAGRMAVSPDDLVGERFPLPAREDFVLAYESMERWMDAVGFHDYETKTVASYPAIPLLVASGQMVSLITDWHAPLPMANLRSVPLTGAQSVCPVFLVWLKANDNPAVPLFVEEAKRVVTQKFGT